MTEGLAIFIGAIIVLLAIGSVVVVVGGLLDSRFSRQVDEEFERRD